MKRQALKTLTISSLVLMLAAVSVCAQSERSKVTNIPFSFVIGQEILPAGEYTFAPNKNDSHNVWLMERQDGAKRALFITMPMRSTETQEEAKLIFHKYGDHYFLSEIWMPGGNSGRKLRVSRAERELVKNAIERQTIVLPIGSAARN